VVLIVCERSTTASQLHPTPRLAGVAEVQIAPTSTKIGVVVVVAEGVKRTHPVREMLIALLLEPAQIRLFLVT
jgi:hypothetical protein